MAIKKQSIIKWTLATLWCLAGAGAIVLLVAAVQKKDSAQCKGVNIKIHGVSNNFFVDKTDIIASIKTTVGGNPIGKPVKSFDLKKIETMLDKNVWVKSAQLFFDNNETLQVNVEEREPVARVFTTSGNTFYIDSSVAILPLSDKFSARLPVFTNFPSDKYVLSKANSVLLKDIRTLSIAIQKDTFSMAMIDQVDINAQRTFDMLPKIGDQLIVFGDATDIEAKFSKLQNFYKEVIMKSGWNYYSTINVQYKGQIVAKRKAAADVIADSLETMRLMKMIATNAEKMSSDSVYQMVAKENVQSIVDTSMTMQSIEREDEGMSPAENMVEPVKAPAAKPVVIFPGMPETKLKPETHKKPAAIKPKPSISKPVVKPAIKPAATKPAAKTPIPAKPKPAVVQKPVAKPATKPATTTPKPTPVKPKPAKPNNDY